MFPMAFNCNWTDNHFQLVRINCSKSTPFSFSRVRNEQKKIFVCYMYQTCTIPKVFVIFWPALFDDFFREEKFSWLLSKNKVTDEKSEHCNLMRNFVCFWQIFIHHRLCFKKAARIIFLLQKIRQMKAGQNNMMLQTPELLCRFV